MLAKGRSGHRWGASKISSRISTAETRVVGINFSAAVQLSSALFHGPQGPFH